LRNLEEEFGESTNAIRLELNKFEKAGFLTSEFEGNKKVFRVNADHPLYHDIRNILMKTIGFDQIIERVATKFGNIEEVYIIGDFARGIDNKIIDLIFVGDDLNKEYLLRLIDKTEHLIKRKIRYLVLDVNEFEDYKKGKSYSDYLLLWKI